MNVVLITMDCLRFDKLQAYGNHTSIMPTIDKLANHGIIFDEVISAANATDPSHVSIFTSCYPNSHGVLENAVVFRPAGHTTLAEAFSNAGYKTVGIVSVEHLSSPFGLNKGFQDYYDNNPLADRIYSIAVKNRVTTVGLNYLKQWIPALYTHWRSADKTNKIALKWLKNNEESKFFLWIHYFDAHHHDFSWSVYDNQLAFIDSHFAQIMRFIESNCHKQEILFVITADHGENFRSDHPTALRHGYSVRDEIIKVPLVFAKIPATEENPKRMPCQVRTIDIAPTLLDMCGIPIPAEWEGVSLKPWIDGKTKDNMDAIFYGYPRWLNCFGIRSNGWKLIVYKNGHQELFNVKEDPQENKNCISDFPEIGKSLRIKLTEHAKVLDIELPSVDDPRIIKMLKGLGYLE